MEEGCAFAAEDVCNVEGELKELKELEDATFDDRAGLVELVSAEVVVVLLQPWYAD